MVYSQNMLDKLDKATCLTVTESSLKQQQQDMNPSVNVAQFKNLHQWVITYNIGNIAFTFFKIHMGNTSTFCAY